MGVYVRNTTGRRMFVLVFTIIYTPFPGGYYSGISLLSPGEGQAFHTFWGHASVLTWPSTGSAQADDRIANILRMVFVTMNTIKAGVNMFGGFLFDWADIFGIAFGGSLMDALATFVVDVVMDSVLRVGANWGLNEVADEMHRRVRAGKLHNRQPVVIRRGWVTMTQGVVGKRMVELRPVNGNDVTVHKVKIWKVWKRRFVWQD